MAINSFDSIFPQTSRLAPGIDCSEIGGPEHFVQFYEDEAWLIKSVARYIGDGFGAGAAGIVIATKPHRDELERQWRAQGWELAALRERGQYVALDAAETLAKCLHAGWPTEQNFADAVATIIATAKSRFSQVRAFGEMVGLLCEDGQQPAAVRLEQLWNGLAKKYSFSLFCAYSMSSLGKEADGKPFLHICNEHSRVIPAESYTALLDPNERLRMISQLQQKANSLQAEIMERKATERSLLRREKELSDFLENAVEGLHRVGPDGTILWANKAELELLGYAPEEYIGHHISEFHADRDVINDILRRLLAGETLSEYPAKLRCKDGSAKHVVIHSNALWENGEFIHTRCFTRDVTESTRLQDELRDRLDQLAEVDRRKDEFLAMLGHELRNPLSPMVTALELARPYNEPEKAKAAFEIMERQLQRLTRLVDDLLDVSRITHGKVQLRQEIVRLDLVVEHAVELARPLMDERRHRFVLELPSEPVLLFVDPARFEQVLANLLNNAAKYTDIGGHISLKASTDGAEVLISVGDTGIGMTPELQDRIFEPFAQGKDSLPRANGGLGIGLTLARSLVHLQGGTLSAQSEGPGLGSEFIVRLPLPAPLAEPAICANSASVHSPIPVPASGRAPSSTRRILVVDDNRDSADSSGMFLRLKGHDVRVAYHGSEALETAAAFDPELVLLDIGLPDLNGYEVAGRIRQQSHSTRPVLIALTGWGHEEDKRRARQAGFDHHLIKPVDLAALEALLLRNVRSHLNPDTAGASAGDVQVD